MAAILADPVQRAAHIDAIVDFAERERTSPGSTSTTSSSRSATERATWSTTRPNFDDVRRGAECPAARRRSVPRRHRPAGLRRRARPTTAATGCTTTEASSPTSTRSGSWRTTTSIDGAPGPIAPLDWVQRPLIDAAVDAAGGPEKLVLGIPLYGYNWLTAARPGTCPDSAEDSISVTLDRVRGAAGDHGNVHRPRVRPRAPRSRRSRTSCLFARVPTGRSRRATQTREVHYLDDRGDRANACSCRSTAGCLGVATLRVRLRRASTVLHRHRREVRRLAGEPPRRPRRPDRTYDGRAMRVHLVDGTYELFRQNFGRSGRDDPRRHAATIGVLTSTLGAPRRRRHPRRRGERSRHRELPQRPVADVQDERGHAARAAGPDPAGRGGARAPWG